MFGPLMWKRKFYIHTKGIYNYSSVYFNLHVLDNLPVVDGKAKDKERILEIIKSNYLSQRVAYRYTVE